MTMGSLQLVQPEAMEIGIAKLDVVGAVTATIQAKGYPTPIRPSQGYQGVIPSDIAGLNDDQLGDLLNQIAAWCDYVEQELALISLARNTAAGQLEFIQSRVRLALKAEQLSGVRKLTDKDKTDIVTTDPRVVDAQSKQLFNEAMYLYVRALMNRAQRDWDTASRRITQRGQESERNRRNDQVGAARGPSGVPVYAHQWRGNR